MKNPTGSRNCGTGCKIAPGAHLILGLQFRQGLTQFQMQNCQSKVFVKKRKYRLNCHLLPGWWYFFAYGKPKYALAPATNLARSSSIWAWSHLAASSLSFISFPCSIWCCIWREWIGGEEWKVVCLNKRYTNQLALILSNLKHLWGITSKGTSCWQGLFWDIEQNS